MAKAKRLIQENLKIIDVVMGLRVTSDEELMGLDLSLHGERIE